MASRITSLTGKPIKRSPAEIEQEIIALRHEQAEATPKALAHEELNVRQAAEKDALEQEWRRFRDSELDAEVEKLEAIRMDRVRREALGNIRAAWQKDAILTTKHEGERRALEVNLQRRALIERVERGGKHFVNDPAGDTARQTYEAAVRRGEFVFDPNGMSIDAQINAWLRGGSR